MTAQPRHFLDLTEVDAQELRVILDGSRRIKEARNSSTWAMLHHHFVTRLGGAAALPNVSALLPQIRANIACWDQGCWEALTHS